MANGAFDEVGGALAEAVPGAAMVVQSLAAEGLQLVRH